MDLCVRAAEAGLDRAGIGASDIDVLIHTGVYRDRNICEPAMAPFIQRRIGANSASPGRGAGERSTFSFDLSNGVCGWLNALQVGDGFLTSGRARRVLLVTGDVDPAPRVSQGLSFAPAAAAVVSGYALTYLALAGLQRVPEVRDVTGLFSRRRRQKPAGPSEPSGDT